MDAKPPFRPGLDIGTGERALPQSHSVLLLVDFINPLEFEGSADLAPGALESARATAALKSRLAREGVPAIYANDNFGVWRSEFRDVLSYCRNLDGEAAEMAEMLAPTPDDLTILKPRHSAFYATPLDLLLTQIQARNIVLVGLAADICVQLSAMDAYLRGYHIWAPSDCTAAESDERKQSALFYMERVLKCEVQPTSDGIPEQLALASDRGGTPFATSEGRHTA